MNIALWTVQVLWGVFFSLTGFGKVLCYKPALWNQALQEVPWFSAVPSSPSPPGETTAGANRRKNKRTAKLGVSDRIFT